MIAVATLTAASIAVVLLRLIPLGIPGVWVVPFSENRSWHRLPEVFLVLGIILLLTGIVVRKLQTCRWYEEAVSVAMLVLFALWFQFAAGALGVDGQNEPFFAVVAPQIANPYFEASGGIEDPLQYLRDYREIASDSEHYQLKTHPPGPVMFFYAIRRVAGVPAVENAVLGAVDRLFPESRNQEELSHLEFVEKLDRSTRAAGWLSIFVLRLAGVLTIVPVYVLARMHYDRVAGFIAAAFSMLIPSMVVFSPLMDQLYPVIGMTALLLAYAAVSRQKIVLNLAAGLVIFAGMFFSVSFIMFIPLVVLIQGWMLFASKSIVEYSGAARRLMLMVEMLLIGMMLGAVAVYAVSRVTIVGMWLNILKVNSEFNLNEGRGYFAWLPLNMIFFAAFLGVPAAVLYTVRLAREGRVMLARRISEIDIMPVAVFAVLAALWLYGANRGEVERLWMPLMPVCAIAAAGRLNLPHRMLLVLLALQGVQAIAFRLGLNTLFNLNL